MIGMLTGTCLIKGQSEAIIDVGGVGYLVQCTGRTLSKLSIGETCCLHIETHMRETAITLYGFASEEARAWFVRLQSVQGIGPKAALAILDVLSPGEILSAASLGDKAAFTRANGIGAKSAGRIVTELAGKAPPMGRGLDIGAFTRPGAGGQSEAMRGEGLSDMMLRNDAVSALVNLGIGQPDALRAVSAAYQTFSEDPPLDDLIKQALTEMSR